MFFVLSKLVWVVAAPVNAMLFLLLLGAVLAWRGARRLGFRLALVAMVALLVVAFSPLGTLLLQPLEESFPQPGIDLAPPTGIVVLGGSTDEVVSDARNQVTIAGAATRVTSAVMLSRRFPNARVVFSGGSGNMLLHPRTEAEDTRSLWIALGVAADRITVEDRSRNTYENALFTRQMLDPKPGERWLLVTSAWHMPRAVGCFRTVGFSVIPYPVDFKTTGTSLDLLPNHDAVEGFERFDLAGKEWVGLLTYRLTGRSSSLLPRPETGDAKL